jgi:murein DD-endopeptidase MepM/ murein hydrolase activator NlpD
MCPVASPVQAKTLQQYKNEVAELEKKLDNTERLSAEAEQKIRSKRNAIASATNTIDANKQSVANSKVLVAESEEQIKIKNTELEDVIKVLQYTGINSEEMYIDYVFESSSVYELMERQSVVEQIVNHTIEELETLEDLINQNKKLQAQLAQDNINLENSITKYENQLLDLQEEISKLATVGLDYKSQIDAQKGLIKIYEEAGCKNKDDIDICYYAKINGNGKFSRPLTKGTVTQTWKNGTHYGIDLGGVPAGTNVYAPANGTIVYTKHKYKCGGNIIYMHAVVDGQKYTIEMAHLKSIKVKIGQVVTKGQVIATQGGDSSTWYYDSCTTGTHMHYSISYGYYFTNATWNGFSTFQKNTKATSVQSISGFKNQKGWKWTTR